MIRNIFFLTRKPQLHEMWVGAVVEYIYESYGNPPQVDAIVGPDSGGFVFDLIVASKLRLPYIPIYEVGKFVADPDDSIQDTFVNRKNKVNDLFEIRRFVTVLV